MLSATFTTSLAAVLLLAASPTHAQNPGSVSSAVASVGGSDTNTGEVVRKLSTPAEEAANPAYYNDSHKDLTQALAWMQETNALHPEYWSLYAEARIRLQLKDYAGAQAKAAEAKKLAVAAANADYARRSDELLTQAKAHAK